MLLVSNISMAKPLQPFSIILDWFVNPTHGPILIANELGYFKQQALQVNIITPADPNDTAKMIALGKADLGVGSDPQLLLLINQGIPLLRVGALIDQPLAALTSNDVKKLAQLKNKTVGYPVGGIDEMIVSLMLQHVGLNISDVELVNVHYNLVQALLSRRVDAIAGAMRNYEVPQLELAGIKIETFYPENYGVPPYAELNYIINQQHRHDKRFTKFFIAVTEATQYIKQHPQRAWQMIIKKHPELNTKLNAISWKMTYPLFPDNPSYTNQRRFMHLVSVLHQHGWLKSIEDYSNYVA